MHLKKYLCKDGERVKIDKDLEGGVRWAITSALKKAQTDEDRYWALASLGDLKVLTADLDDVEKAYLAAVAKADKNWFNLDSCRQQLLLLNDVGFRPDVVQPAVEIFDRELAKIAAPKKEKEPRYVFLFSGHMIDAPNRAEPRFPPEKETIAAQAIAAKLDEFAGSGWVNRFYKIKNHPNTTLLIMPRELGVLPRGRKPFERNNKWLLYTALAHGSEKVKFICLWNRQGGDGPGGTKHLYNAVLQHDGQVIILDTTTLW